MSILDDLSSDHKKRLLDLLAKEGRLKLLAQLKLDGIAPLTQRQAAANLLGRELRQQTPSTTPAGLAETRMTVEVDARQRAEVQSGSAFCTAHAWSGV